MKSLYRSRTNRVLGGVFGGLGEVYNVDPNILRLGYALLALVTGILPAVVLYAVAWIVLPEKTTVNAR